jgi:hypothetical protein
MPLCEVDLELGDDGPNGEIHIRIVSDKPPRSIVLRSLKICLAVTGTITFQGRWFASGLGTANQSRYRNTC